MKTNVLCILGISLVFAACGTPFQGIKVRVQAPALEEGFRKISLAVSVDGYEVEKVDPSRYELTTHWREAKEKEISAGEKSSGVTRIECRLILRMDVRGKLYDVFCTPWLRYLLADGTVREKIADVTHPLREKWEEVFRRLLVREAKEED